LRYTKPPISSDKQADLLIARGMGGNRAQIIERLNTVGYFRLSAYSYPFRTPNPADPANPIDTFRAGTDFVAVWSRYVFDRHLRLLVLDAIERIEVAVRSLLVHHHADRHGPFGYALNQASMPGLKWPEWVDYLSSFKRETERSKDTFVKHFKTKYGDVHSCMPVWMTVELMTFGSLLSFFRGTSNAVKTRVANYFGMPPKVFASWMLTLNTVRNICAHHSRLWNREIGTAPLIPLKKKYPDWHLPSAFPPNRMFATLTICKWSVDRVAPQSQWQTRLRALLTANPNIPLAQMGFPNNWDQCPVWANQAPAAPAGGLP
jgi:abortive infection bacteriophage resistance protein